ncbi:hypothetical protein KQX54_002770 [Cotesia glomerata]|uniref:Uncharacterized protein n=1 Tax=Cotesia glomerata TaxID=32391 RepID=A0AAV7IHR9_COTGL|nr:hypothetical protein KQX54_002770 [Cotesia glomerata]
MDKVIAVIRCPPQHHQDLPTGSLTVLMVRESAVLRSSLSDTEPEPSTSAQPEFTRETRSKPKSKKKSKSLKSRLVIVSEPKSKPSWFSRICPWCVKKPKPKKQPPKRRSRLESIPEVSPKACGSNRRLSAAEIRRISRQSASFLDPNNPDQNLPQSRKKSSDSRRASNASVSSKRHSKTRNSEDQRLSIVESVQAQKMEEKTSQTPELESNSSKIEKSSLRDSKSSNFDSRKERKSKSVSDSTSRKKRWSFFSNSSSKKTSNVSDQKLEALRKFKGSKIGENGESEPRISKNSSRRESKDIMDQTTLRLNDLSRSGSSRVHSDARDQITLQPSDFQKELRSSSRNSGHPSSSKEGKRPSKESSCGSKCSAARKQSSDESGPSVVRKCQRQRRVYCYLAEDFVQGHRHSDHSRPSIVEMLTRLRDSTVRHEEAKMCKCSSSPSSSQAEDKKRDCELPADLLKDNNNTNINSLQICECQDNNSKRLSRSEHKVCGCTNDRCREK